MTDVTYDVYLSEVLPKVPGIAELIAIDAIRSAVIEFCDETDWLSFEHDPITTLANTHSYEFDVEGDYVEARIVQAWHEGRPLTPTNENELRQRYVNSDWRTVIGTPSRYLQISKDTIRLVPTPIDKTVNGLRMLIATKPTRDSDVADESIYQTYAEAIGWGARARLHEIPGQQSFNMELAAFNRARFREAITKAKIERNRGLTRSNLRVQMRPF